MSKIDILIETKAMCKQHIADLEAVLGQAEALPVTMQLTAAIDEIDREMKAMVKLREELK